MVAQAAIPLAMLASSMGLSIPAVVDYFKGQNVDLSNYGENDLVDIETIFPQTESQRIKEFKTYEDSFYTPKPVTENTDLSDIILQTKKDDDEKITTIDQEGNVLPDLPDQMPDPNDDGPKIDINWKRLAEILMEKAVDQTVTKLEDKVIDIQKKKKKGVNFAPEKTDNITRLHKMRLQNIIDGKTDTYPGGPQNERIVLNGPEGSDLPPIAIGNINFEDWTNKITLSDEEIFNQKDWYKKVYESFAGS